MLDASERFWAKVNKTEGCWEWMAARDQGYGRFQYEGRTQRAHRVSLILSGITVPPGMVVDHLCFNRACVRPSHLQFLTSAENSLRHRSSCLCSFCVRPALKTHCKNGHDLRIESAIHRTEINRRCRECTRKYNRASERRRRERRASSAGTSRAA